ncbi:MAG: hypothetical protein ACLFVI_08970 [Archaeoglobaceae archaeon]
MEEAECDHVFKEEVPIIFFNCYTMHNTYIHFTQQALTTHN